MNQQGEKYVYEFNVVPYTFCTVFKKTSLLLDCQVVSIEMEKVFEFLSRKAKTSKFWAILLTFAVLYEIIEHIVWPILVPYLMYMQWFK